MLRVVSSLGCVLEDVQVGSALAVRLQVGRPNQRSNHPSVTEDLQQKTKVHLGRQDYCCNFLGASHTHHFVLPGLVEIAVFVEDSLQNLVELLPLC